MNKEISKLMANHSNPIKYLKKRAGAYIIKKYLGDEMHSIWTVVAPFLAQEQPDELSQYHVELSELSADNFNWKSLKKSFKKAAEKSAAAVKRSAKRTANYMKRGARALGKIVSTIAGKLGESCGACAKYGTNAVYFIIRHLVPSSMKKHFKAV